jgi:hypothetical protein
MIKSVTALLGTLVLGLVLNTTQGEAADDGAPGAPKTKATKQMPFRGKIVRVDVSAQTITLGGKERDRTFHVTETTRVTKDGRSAKLADVVVGDKVGGLARANGADRWDVVTLNVGEKPDPAGSGPAKRTGTTD